MHKRLSIFLKVLTGMLFMLACQKQTSLIPNENTLAGIHDTIPHDTIPHDTIPHDTIPHDTIPPRDTITGLNITPEISSDDSTIILNFESKNTFPDLNPRLWNYPVVGDSSLVVWVLGVHRNQPSSTANNTAKAVIHYKPDIYGNHPFSIHLTGHPGPLVGWITVTDKFFTFNWNHDSVVTIHPKILHR